MFKQGSFGIAVALATLAFLGSHAAHAATSSQAIAAHIDLAESPAEYVRGELMVGFRPGSSHAAVRAADARAGARVVKRYAALGMELVKLPHGRSMQAAIRRYTADSSVSFAEPNYRRFPTVAPADPLFGGLWGLDNVGQSHPVSDADGDGLASPHAGTADADIDAPEAWDVQTGSGTVVAVIDTGIDVTHPDLANQLWTNAGEIAADGIDNDGNGKVDDVHGWDFGDNDATLLDAPPYFDGYEHGTHVAGTIAAALDGTTGVVGVCPGCKVMALKIARDSDGAMTVSNLVAALAYARSMHAKIANLSLGSPAWSNADRTALARSGLLAVVSAGNDSLDNDMALASDLDGDGNADVFSPSYPAAYTLPNILAVAASNDSDENAYSTECHAKYGLSKPRCAFTNWGHDSIDLSAPGVDVTSTVPGGSWDTWDGTSMAAPHAAGVAALVLAQHPTYTLAQVKNAVMHSVDHPASLKAMYLAARVSRATTKTGRFTRTAGRVNAASALSASTTNATPTTDGNVNGARAWRVSPVQGALSWPADVNDVYKRWLRAGHVYRITLVVPAGKDYDLFVWKPGAKEIWQFSKLRTYGAHSGSLDEVVRFKARTSGTYYIHASAWIFKSGRYTLRFRRVS